MLLNLVLALTNASAACAARKLHFLPLPSHKKLPLLALLALSAASSAGYHLCEHAVRSNGLPGVGASYGLEYSLLLADRLFAVVLTLYAARCLPPSAAKLLAALRRNIKVLALASASGVFSELRPPRHGPLGPAVAAVALGVCAALWRRDGMPMAVAVIGGFALLGRYAPPAWYFVVSHGLWHVFIYWGLAQVCCTLCDGEVANEALE
jgi:hypothetical protein